MNGDCAVLQWISKLLWMWSYNPFINLLSMKTKKINKIYLAFWDKCTSFFVFLLWQNPFFLVGSIFFYFVDLVKWFYAAKNLFSFSHTPECKSLQFCTFLISTSIFIKLFRMPLWSKVVKFSAFMFRLFAKYLLQVQYKYHIISYRPNSIILLLLCIMIFILCYRLTKKNGFPVTEKLFSFFFFLLWI